MSFSLRRGWARLNADAALAVAQRLVQAVASTDRCSLEYLGQALDSGIIGKDWSG